VEGNATCQQCGAKFFWPDNKTCPICSVPGGKDKTAWQEASKNRGKREIGGKVIYFPNRWEANYYRYLLWLKEQEQILDFVYQPKPAFDFSEWHRHGTNSYRVDFKVMEVGGGEKYVEVKGWMDGKSKVKLNRMRKYYPKVKIELIQRKEYNGIKLSMKGLIADWE